MTYKQKSLEDEPEVFFNPNDLCKDGTISQVAQSFSEDGKIWAVGLSFAGSDWFEVRFKNTETGKLAN